MPELGILATFALVHLLAAASPGPNLIIVSSYAAVGSRRACLLLILGILLGVLTWSSMTALGLGAVLARYPTAYAVLQYAGAAYLVWLGLRMIFAAICNRSNGLDISPPPQRSAHSLVLTGYLVNMTNPKTIAYYTSLFAVLIPAESPGWLFSAAVAVALLVSSLWWIFVALLFSTGTVRRLYALLRRSLDLIMGGALIVLGFRLATDR